MMRGDRISVRAIATRWRMPPDSSLRILARVALDVEPDLGDPFARALAPLARRHAAALEAERDVVFDGPVVERRVVLKHHAAIGAGSFDRLLRRPAHVPFARRMVRPQARDQPQHRRLAAAGRPENGDELAFARPVLDRERHVADDREVSEPLGHAAELDDAWTFGRHAGHSSTAR